MNRQIVSALLFASLILAVSFFGKTLQEAGIMAAGPERVAGIVGGLVLIWFGNAMPKTAPDSGCCGSEERSFRMKRFAGWIFMLAGFAHVVIWAAAPSEKMAWMSIVPVALGLLLVLFTAFRTRTWV